MTKATGEATSGSGDLLSLAQVARLKGVSRVAVYYAVRSGQLPAVHVGNSWVVRARDLDRYRPRRKRQ